MTVPTSNKGRLYTNKNGKIRIYGEGEHVKVWRQAFEELIEDYEKTTEELGDKILSTAKNRFKTEKNEFVRRKNFITTIKQNVIF